MQYRQEWESNMEQELSKNTYVLQEDEKIGTVKIADDVVAMIAALAATEVEATAFVSCLQYWAWILFHWARLQIESESSWLPHRHQTLMATIAPVGIFFFVGQI